MSDAYDRLRRLQTLRGSQGAKYLATTPGALPTSPSGPSPAPPPASQVIPANQQTFVLSGGGVITRVSGSVTGNYYVACPAPWPPVGGYYTQFPADFNIPPHSTGASKTYQQKPGDECKYEVGVGLLKFDTSLLPDTAQVATATLRVFGFADSQTTPDRLFTLEWATWTGVNADWTATEGTSAHTGTFLKNLPFSQSWFELALKDPAVNVSKTGMTYLKCHISGGDPSLGTSPYAAPGAIWNQYAVVFKGGGAGGAGFSQPEFTPQLVIGYG